ncbi:MAG TPA: DUF5677 domain-containing protein [Anaerolineaceae bacterium]|nr:DUF5677 domain-containing protein [Anaerolineaceae bacterium]
MTEENIVIPVTPEILDIVKLIEELENRLAAILRKVEERLGKYEAEKEAFNLLVIIIRNLDGFLLMLKKDLCLLAPGEALARPAFEIAVRLLWMLAPNDPFEREARWIAHLKNEEENRENMAKFWQEIGKAQGEDITLQDVRKFREGISNLLLEKGYHPLEKMPSLRRMMKDIHEEEKYIVYMILCQSTHGTHIATWKYRRNLGCSEIAGEFITPKDWVLGIRIILYSLIISGKRFLEVMGEDKEEWVTDEEAARLDNKIRKLVI